MSNALKRYSPADVRDIIGRAMKKDTASGDVSLDELRATAHELGISSDALENALAEHDARVQLEQSRGAYVEHRRQRFMRQLATYGAINAGLVGLDLASGGGLSFSPVVLAAWGVAILASAARTFTLTDEDIDHGAAKLLKARQKRERRLLGD